MDTINTWYGDIKSELLRRFSKVELLILDVDGVFSDGRIYLGDNGEELKAFHTRDGFGLKALANAGFEVAVITGRQSNIVQHRMQHLKVKHIFQGQSDKTVAYQQLLTKLNLEDSQVAYVGDDIPDLELIKQCGLGIAVHDAHPAVQQGADYVTGKPGGFGAVREVCDLILLAHGRLHQAEGISL
ncbi:3-deoxy-manno-octulosonate-8-phosphatase KdsC [Idiomarina seosinensis]|uniref:3-deoxy-D-manno-octulosonate 8-phosphate phosphatase KdsC n=1 Tax=Idiomarina seosinensis TaxID=281739 RepID=A0A432ZD97_9GAMM|nr:3-deoxy-manno-octulosonate-8-phosphatase KdsC [Idiomarina seosinensis]RUO75916.1 3-deoxy-manno-octulosonate-8-phosphatase KdsC [Idiomarina seosinensis]